MKKLYSDLGRKSAADNTLLKMQLAKQVQDDDTEFSCAMSGQKQDKDQESGIVLHNLNWLIYYQLYFNGQNHLPSQVKACKS